MRDIRDGAMDFLPLWMHLLWLSEHPLWMHLLWLSEHPCDFAILERRLTRYHDGAILRDVAFTRR